MRLRSATLVTLALGLLAGPLAAEAQQLEKLHVWILWEERTTVFMSAILTTPLTTWEIVKTFESKEACDSRVLSILAGAKLLAEAGPFINKDGIEDKYTVVKEDRYTRTLTGRDNTDPKKFLMVLESHRLLCLPAGLDPRPPK